MENLKQKQIDIITDLLTDFDEMGFAPTTLCPEPEAYAIDWKNKLTNALQGYRKQSEGEWEIVKGSHGKEIMVCTNCRHSQDLHSTFTYCPNCGARMHGAKMKGGAE